MFYFQIVIFESTTVCCPTLKIALTCHSSLNISLNDFNFIRGSSASRASMTSLSPLSESPSTSSLSLSPSTFIQPDTSAMHRIRFEELIQKAEVRILAGAG